MPEPKLLLSVTGGARNFDVDKRLKKEFKRGLFNAASTSNAWVISGGTNFGVMEWVGSCFGDEIFLNNNVCIGIATYTMLADIKKFVNIFLSHIQLFRI